MKAVVRCVNFNSSPSQIRCLGPSVVVKDFGHKNGRITQSSSPSKCPQRFSLTSGGTSSVES